MNQFEMIVLIVAIVMISGIFRAKYRHPRTIESDPADKAENLRLREEVKELKDRVKVLERITVEKENSLSTRIEELRDR
ncbi:MAG TPA: hypothetical protein VFP53_01280 [Sphingomicrobium sp.]|nr:hypothetical protein [Sphingomicrobium sp.]